jgi:hypothetical protein
MTSLLSRITSAEGGTPLPRTYPAIFARALSRVRHRAAIEAGAHLEEEGK